MLVSAAAKKRTMMLEEAPLLPLMQVQGGSNSIA